MKKNNYDIEGIRDNFPALKQTYSGKDFVYLDSASSTQKPQEVIDMMSSSSYIDYANIHRGVYKASQNATENYEATRLSVAKYINSKSPQEIIFTKSATESINLVANSLASYYLSSGDEIILSQMEHHANIVPWMMVSERLDIRIKVINLNHDGTLDLDHFKNLLSERTKVVAITHCSNVLGTINPVKEIIELSKKFNALTLIDGTQSVVHEKVDVQEINCDFFVFSSHKLYGPTGVGVLYGKESILNRMPPYQGGGDMIEEVSFTKVTYNKIPQKFEAGTPNISGVVAFKSAIDYIEGIGLSNIRSYENDSLKYATKKLLSISGLKILGNASNKAPVISFIIDGYHAEDLGVLIDLAGVAVRTGQHCCHPLMDYYKISSTVRVSLGMYNNFQDIDKLIASIYSAIKILG